MSNKVPLALAADNFATICHAIDEGNLDETIVALFNDTRLDLKASVDRRISFLHFCGANIEAAKQARDAWRERVKQLEHVEERIKKMTVEIMRAHDSIEYKGELGRICLQKNPEALDLAFATFDTTVNRVLDPNALEHYNIPDKYLKKFALYQLDTKQVKEDLQAGAELSWATLSRGVHLRIRQ